MDKFTIDTRLTSAQVRIDQVATELYAESDYREVYEKLIKIISMIDECKEALSIF